MAEKLTWDEIKRKYPDEYVLMVDPEVDGTTMLTAGTVVGHSRDKDRMQRALLKLKAKHTALFWTGEVRGLVRFSPVEVEE